MRTKLLFVVVSFLVSLGFSLPVAAQEEDGKKLGKITAVYKGTATLNAEESFKAGSSTKDCSAFDITLLTYDSGKVRYEGPKPTNFKNGPSAQGNLRADTDPTNAGGKMAHLRKAPNNRVWEMWLQIAADGSWARGKWTVEAEGKADSARPGEKTRVCAYAFDIKRVPDAQPRQTSQRGSGS